MSQSILAKLAAGWAKSPNLRFGQFLESVENLAWDLGGQRDYSTRLMNLPDALLETALDQWITSPAARVRWTVTRP